MREPRDDDGHAAPGRAHTTKASHERTVGHRAVKPLSLIHAGRSLERARWLGGNMQFFSGTRVCALAGPPDWTE